MPPEGVQVMKKVLSLLSLCLITFVSISQAQQPQQKQEQVDDVVRTTTELVQTDVLVFDRRGRFVEGLKAEQFELRVDGKAQPVSFFEQVAAGSAMEEALRTNQGAQVEVVKNKSQAVERGRTVIFFVDDLHLSLDSMERTRRALRYFIEKEMRAGDEVAVVAASGNIGFLGQFTENKAVLRAAVERLVRVPYTVRDVEHPPMTEYIAIKIEHGDRDAIGFYVEHMARSMVTKGGNKALNQRALAEVVKSRARQIVTGVESVTASSLSSLESLMRSSSEIPGRKLVFFISDGFYLDPKRGSSAATAQLKRVTNAATRAGVVVYTIDARGLFSGAPDATGDRPVDSQGRIDRANVGEVTLSQDGLHALAEDTGGRATRNSSALDEWVKNVLQETSNYYVLAWRPQTEEQRDVKYKHIEVSVVGRPELTVRLPRGLFINEGMISASAKGKDSKTSAATNQPAVAKTPDAEMRSALTGFAPKRNLKTRVATTFLDVPNSGLVLTASTQVSVDALSYGEDGKQKAAVDLAGVVLNDKGKPVNSFKTRLNVDPLSTAEMGANSSSVIYNYKTPLAPGIYQVRVAVRDSGNGRVGSAMQWIEIPDLSARRLSLSSLIVGGMAGSAEKNGGEARHAPQFQPSVDRRFVRASHLSFWVFIYNAGRGGGGAPDLSAQVEVYRGSERIISTPQRKLKTEGMTDLGRIPYGGDFALSSLKPGRYVLEVKIRDGVAGTTASERISFEVE
jgi:VWFA-related protein